MKRIISISFVAFAAMLFVSCKSDLNTQQVQPGYKTITLNAVAEQHDGISKTVFDGFDVIWQKGDKILVVNEKNVTAELRALHAGVSTTFSGSVPDDFGQILYAFYPADAYSGMNINNRTVTLKLKSFTEVENKDIPDVDERDPEDTEPTFINSIGGGANPSFACVNGQENDVKFKNICGILKVPVRNAAWYGKYTEGSTDPHFTFTLKTEKDGEALSGDFTFNFETETLSSAKKDNPGTQAVKINGWVMNMTASFYFVLPAGTLSEGFSVVAHDYFDQEAGMRLKSDQTIKRSTVKAMPQLVWEEHFSSTGKNTLSPDTGY